MLGANSQSEELPKQQLNKYRISITMTCEQHQLMPIITQLGQYGTAPLINVQKE